MRVARYSIIALVLLAGAAALAWYVQRPGVVTTVRPTRGDAAEIVYASAVVEPRQWTQVTPLVRERIVELCGCESEDVEQGDVLARLDDREARAALAELEARERLANDQLRRLTVLTERNVATQTDLDRARSEVAQVEALIAGQTARLESYVLRAPVDGVVLREDGEVGEIAEPGNVLFWVGRPTPIRLVADVNEEDIPRIEVGQRALVRSDAFPNEALEAEVDSVTPKGDPVSKTYRVRLALPDDTPLMIGMTVDVNVVIRVSRDALLVPVDAVDGEAVFLVVDGKATRKRVEVGIRGASGVEVLSGIGEDAMLISPYPESLTEGARVRPQGG